MVIRLMMTAYPRREAASHWVTLSPYTCLFEMYGVCIRTFCSFSVGRVTVVKTFFENKIRKNVFSLSLCIPIQY